MSDGMQNREGAESDDADADADVGYKLEVLGKAIAEHRRKLWLFASATVLIIVGSTTLMVVGAAIDKNLLDALVKIGGARVASMLLASLGSVPTVRECVAQWQALRAKKDMQRGYRQAMSKATVEKLDELFWYQFKGRLA